MCSKLKIIKNQKSIKNLCIESLPLPLLSTESILFLKNKRSQKCLIGKGSYGSVYLARIKETSELVAVKTFKHDDQKEINNEARILCYLSQTEAVPTFFGLIIPQLQNASPLLVQEFFGKGLTLSMLVKDIELLLPTASWLHICIQLSRGLKKIHEMGILLNDIKMDNILVDHSTSDIQVRFIDFGCASTLKGIVFEIYDETFVHIAPEVKEKFHTTCASDIFSLGHVFQIIYLQRKVYLLKSIIASCVAKRAQKRIHIKYLLEDLKSLQHEVLYYELRNKKPESILKTLI